MRRLLERLSLGMAGAAATAATAAAQVNPTASSVQEEALMQALQSGQTVTGRITIPDSNAAVLIDPGGRDWAVLHSSTLQWITIVAILGMLALLVIFYLVRGRIRIDAGFSGRKILRFTMIERFAHWLLAVSFIVLALTGLNLILGRALLLPLIGENAFGTLSAWGKIAHNYLSWPFMLALVMVFLLWVVHNIPGRLDWIWLKQAGGLFQKGVHPPAKKFNAGQKLIFWSVIIGGALMSWSGIMLLFPGEVGSAGEWQFYQVMHAVVAAVMVAIVLAHIYIGSLGMEGAFDAMGNGEVDENWAREHHSLWVEERMRGKTTPSEERGPTATPAE
jgi:formate dehydrogenase subunit gamma